MPRSPNEGFLAGVNLLGFCRCPICHRYGQLTASRGLTQCGDCWRQGEDFEGLDTASIEPARIDPC
jgi:hypothetical protein